MQSKPHGLRPEQFLAAIVESSSDAILGKTLDGTVLSWNAAAERLYGYSAEEMLGRSIAVIVPPDRTQELGRILADVRRGTIVQDLLTERTRKDGSRITVSITVSPVKGPDGRVVGASTIARDVGAYVQEVEDLDQAQRVTAEALSLLDTLQSSAPVGFCFVDCDFRFLRVNEKLAAINGVAVEEHIGRTLAEVTPKFWPQLEPSYRKVVARGEPVLNVEVRNESGEDPGNVHYWLQSFYPVRVNEEMIGVGAVVMDITERSKADEARRAFTRSAVDAIAAMTEARDPYTAGHQSRVAAIASAIAADLGFDDGRIEGIDLAARIHDIGKIAVPAEILTRSTMLSAPEWELIKSHARVGADIVRGIEFPWPVAEMIEQHHERLDGSGYPDGLQGEEILLEAQIIAVADVVEAMSSHRPYRPAVGMAFALEELRRGRGTLFDADVVDSCLRILAQGSYNLDRDAASVDWSSSGSGRG